MSDIKTQLKEHAEKCKKAHKDHKFRPKWSKYLDLKRLDLKCENLCHINLCGANLSGSNLQGANLYGADLSRTVLTGVDLSGANLSRTNLTAANLRYANLTETDLNHSVLLQSDLSDSDLSGADLRFTDLREANLSGSNLTGADFEDSDISNTNFTGVKGFQQGPCIENLVGKILEEVKTYPHGWMQEWHHPCGTVHCMAGTAIHLAGEEGRKLDEELGTSAAGALIFISSGYPIVPNFYCDDMKALLWLKDNA